MRAKTTTAKPDLFLNRELSWLEFNHRVLEEALGYYRLKVLGWRDVPVSSDCLGKLALEAEPVIRQVFVDGGGLDQEQLERRLFMARKRAEQLVSRQFGEKAEDFYVASLSCRTISTKACSWPGNCSPIIQTLRMSG